MPAAPSVRNPIYETSVYVRRTSIRLSRLIVFSLNFYRLERKINDIVMIGNNETSSPVNERPRLSNFFGKTIVIDHIGKGGEDAGNVLVDSKLYFV